MATHSNILASKNPKDRGAWPGTVHRVAQSRAQLKQLSTHILPKAGIYSVWLKSDGPGNLSLNSPISCCRKGSRCSPSSSAYLNFHQILSKLQVFNLRKCIQSVGSDAQSCLILWPCGLQYARLPRQSPTPKAFANSGLSCRWCHPTVSSSVIPFSSCLQSFPPSGSFQMSQFVASRGRSIGVSASASVLPMNIQDWFPLGWTVLITLPSKGLSRVFSNNTVQKHQFFALSFLYGPILTSIHWKNHSLD